MNLLRYSRVIDSNDTTMAGEGAGPTSQETTPHRTAYGAVAPSPAMLRKDCRKTLGHGYKITLYTALAFVIYACAFSARAQEPAEVRLFDTGSPAAGPIKADALAKRAGWTQIPEDQTQHAFKGDAVVLNERLAVVLRKRGSGAEIYSLTAQGPVSRASVTPCAKAPAQNLTAVGIIANDAQSVSIDATYQGAASAAPIAVNYELKVGQPAVQIQSRREATGVRLTPARCRFVVLPDFFADDMVIDATTIKADHAEVPADNFLMHMVNDAIVLAVWDKAQDDIQIALRGEGSRRGIPAPLFNSAGTKKARARSSSRCSRARHLAHARNRGQ